MADPAMATSVTEDYQFARDSSEEAGTPAALLTTPQDFRDKTYDLVLVNYERPSRFVRPCFAGI